MREVVVGRVLGLITVTGLVAESYISVGALCGITAVALILGVAEVRSIKHSSQQLPCESIFAADS